jgi:hypothetical protein
MNNSMKLYCTICDSHLDAPLFKCPRGCTPDPDRMVKAQLEWAKEQQKRDIAYEKEPQKASILYADNNLILADIHSSGPSIFVPCPAPIK